MIKDDNFILFDSVVHINNPQNVNFFVVIILNRLDIFYHCSILLLFLNYLYLLSVI